MPLTIPDDVLEQAGLTEREAAIEIACRLFDAGLLHLWPAAQLASLSRVEFEEECHKRGVPVYRYTEAEYERDLETIGKLEEVRAGRQRHIAGRA